MRDQYGLQSWDEFNRALEATPPGNKGGILLPWFDPEIVPRVNQPGLHRFDLAEKDGAANCRALVEAQMMSMRLHSQWMEVSPDRIYATGGASNNLPLLQVMANVMNCPVSRMEVSKSAALGAALRAAHGWLVHSGKKPKWEQVVDSFTEPIADSVVKPQAEAVRVYDKLIEKYARCEREALKRVA
jgi:xylulokinase